jgi:hypothetical protein
MRSKLLKEGFKEINGHGQGIPKLFQFFFNKLGIPSNKFKNKKGKDEEGDDSDSLSRDFGLET